MADDLWSAGKEVNMYHFRIECKGFVFERALDAKWAAFFEACGANWEYKTESFDFGNGILFRPTFVLRDTEGRAGGTLYVLVPEYPDKDLPSMCSTFAAMGHSLLVVGELPEGNCMDDIINEISSRGDNHFSDWPTVFNFEYVDGDEYPAHPGVNQDGKFELFGDDCNYLEAMDFQRTMNAWRVARRFDSFPDY